MNNINSICLYLLISALSATSLYAQNDAFTNDNTINPKPILSKENQSLFVPLSNEHSKLNTNTKIEKISSKIKNNTSINSSLSKKENNANKKAIEHSFEEVTQSIEKKQQNENFSQSIEGSVKQKKADVEIKKIQETSANKIDIKDKAHSIEGSRPSSKEIYKNFFQKKIKNINYNNKSYYLYSHKHLEETYRYFGYKSLWMNDSLLSNHALELIKEIKKAEYHALPSKLYHYNQFKSLNKNSIVDEPEILDILLTDAFATYKEHLSNGILNPKDYFPEWNTPKQDLDLVLDLIDIKKGQSIESNLDKVNNQNYFTLVKEYKKKLLDKQKIENHVKVPNQKMMLGDSGNAIKVLRDRLGLSLDTNVFDDELLSAVKLYQQANNLSSDGIVGEKTIRELNEEPINYIKSLTASLERMRWGNEVSNKKAYVWINIPSYTMSVRENGETLFLTDTIVGKPSRPTPVFQDTLEYVVLAPYWNVPKTIFIEDKLPLLKKNSSALGPEMQVIKKDTGKVVSPFSVNWRKGGKGYRLRQKPGPKNALGLMKFLFPNRHAIYMHDTPKKHLFNRKYRAISSGCVRLKKAEGFAFFLLKHHNYSKDRIKENSNGNSEKWVKLDDSLRYPVYLNYLTAWVNSEGKVKYSQDIYNYDKRLNNEYQQTLSGI